MGCQSRAWEKSLRGRFQLSTKTFLITGVFLSCKDLAQEVVSSPSLKVFQQRLHSLPAPGLLVGLDPFSLPALS